MYLFPITNKLGDLLENQFFGKGKVLAHTVAVHCCGCSSPVKSAFKSVVKINL